MEEPSCVHGYNAVSYHTYTHMLTLTLQFQ